MRDSFDEGPYDPMPARPSSTLRWAVLWFLLCVGGAALVPMLRNSAPQGKAPGSLVGVAKTIEGERRAAINTQSYAADRNGHFLVAAAVNGAPVRFLVDTGATYVALSREDAAAAGINLNTLNFDRRVMTANGEGRAAALTLRELRLGQMAQEEVPAMVIDAPMPVSLLGMSFLKRLTGYEIRDGKLYLDW
jgi:aspartyl protease family protein